MRPLLILLGTAVLAAGEVPTLTRSGVAAPLAYDLAATAPWMPLLWERLALILPAGATACRITASFAAGTGLGADASDLLALREGHRLAMAGTAFTVAGVPGTWSGAGPSVELVVDRAIAASDLLLAVKQLHYANLGGVRTLARRRIEVRVAARVAGTWGESAPLAIEVDGVAADQPPRLRLDDLVVPLGGGVDWRLLGWYDGRDTAATMWWRLAGTEGGLRVSGATGVGRSDLTAELASAKPFDLFATSQLQLHPGTALGRFACSIAAGDGRATATLPFDVVVTAPSGGLQVLGDLPLAVAGCAVATLRASRTDTVIARYIPHPGIDECTPLSAQAVDGRITVTIDPALYPGRRSIAGTLVLGSGGGEFRLPYRITLAAGTAN